MFDTSLNWVKYCCFKFCTKAKSPFVSSWNSTGILPIRLNAFSILFACLLNPSLTTVSDQPRYSLSTIAFIFGLIAIAAWSSISFPSVCGKSLLANDTTSRSILSNVETRVLYLITSANNALQFSLWVH